MLHDYFYGEQANLFSFYRLPKVLFTDRKFQKVSIEAKVLYGLLLELDSFFKGTDGGVLGIEPLLDAVTYTRRLPLEHLDEASLDRQVGRHVDTVESLRASIAQLKEQAATPQAAAEAGWNDGMLKI